MISRHGEHRYLEGTKEPGRVLVLFAGSPVGEIARSDDQLWADPPDEGGQRLLDLQILTCTRIGDRIHGGGMPPRPNEAIDS